MSALSASPTFARNSRARSFDLGARHAQHGARAFADVGQRIHVREQLEALEHHADLPPDLARFAAFHADLATAEQDAIRGRSVPGR